MRPAPQENYIWWEMATINWKNGGAVTAILQQGKNPGNFVLANSGDIIPKAGNNRGEPSREIFLIGEAWIYLHNHTPEGDLQTDWVGKF